MSLYRLPGPAQFQHAGCRQLALTVASHGRHELSGLPSKSPDKLLVRAWLHAHLANLLSQNEADALIRRLQIA